MKGITFNVQRFSTEDGPGIRTTVSLKGCPLCCAWRHNPTVCLPEPDKAQLEAEFRAQFAQVRLAFAVEKGGENV